MQLFVLDIQGLYTVMYYNMVCYIAVYGTYICVMFYVNVEIAFCIYLGFVALIQFLT
jgi:hypothetical protein